MTKRDPFNKAGKPWIVAFTGASGQRYGLRLLEVLSSYKVECAVIVSDAVRLVLAAEENINLPAKSLPTSRLLFKHRFPRLKFYDPSDFAAPLASGSTASAGMVVIPCSMDTLAAVANGLSQNLIQRAADVTLKENRKLILVPRETPLSAIHLENMLKAQRAGATILPAMPGFYHAPKTVDQLVDHLIMKVLDQMGIENQLTKRWSEREA